MHLDLSVYNIIILLGGIQGIILSFVLFFSKKEYRKANRFLAILILIMAVVNLDLFSDDSNFIELYQLPFTIPNLYLGIGPALFFYTKNLINPTNTLSKKDLLHFLPVTIECIYYLSLTWWITEAGVAFHFWIIEPVESYSSMLALLCYIYLSNLLLRNYQNNAENKANYKFRKLVARLRWLLFAMIIILVLWFALYFYWDYRFKLMGYNSPQSNLIEFFPVLLALTLVIYIIGFSGLYRGESITIITEQLQKKNKSSQKAIVDIPEEKMSIYIEQIKNAMQEEKLYLDPDLSLSMLANHLELNPKYLSFILNSGLDKNFNDFVNKYRVEEVKKRLLNPEYENLTIIGVAMDSGFNSKSAFNRIFKDFTQMSPKEYKDSYSAK